MKPEINRRQFIKTLGFTAGAVMLGGCANQGQFSSGKTSAKKPNFVIIFSDDLGYGDLSCFGCMRSFLTFCMNQYRNSSWPLCEVQPQF